LSLWCKNLSKEKHCSQYWWELMPFIHTACNFFFFFFFGSWRCKNWPKEKYCEQYWWELKPFYTHHTFFLVVFVAVVQKLAKRKTLHPILVRIKALYTLCTSFLFSFFFLLSLSWCKNWPKEKHCAQYWQELRSI